MIILFLFFSFSLLKERTPLAFLYTDPGSGALIWQLLLAAFFGAIFYLRFYLRKLKGMVSDRKKLKADYTDAPDETDATHAAKLAEAEQFSNGAQRNE